VKNGSAGKNEDQRHFERSEKWLCHNKMRTRDIPSFVHRINNFEEF
jgi:hypothetical protein